MARALLVRWVGMLLDLRYALRMMAKTPGLTAVLVITLALGIGASTTIFSIVHSILLRPLPYEQPDRLARIYTEFHGGLDLERFWVSPPEFDDLRRSCRSCESVAAWTGATASLGGGDRPVRIEAAFATHELLPLLGVKPELGRWFDAAEDRPGDSTVIVLGHDVWKRAFDGDPNIVGRTIQLDAHPVTVIGVMPAGFDFLDREEAWIPLNLDLAKENRGGHYLNVVVRTAPGVSMDQLTEEIHSLAAGWGKLKGPKTHAITTDDHPMIVRPFHADLVGDVSTTLWLLQGAVLFVLLISVVNVANLLLAKSETRTREVAVRHALGASRRRLVRQFVTESLLLALFGGALGVLVSAWALDGVTALIPKSAPRANEISLDVSAVVFAVGCAIASALLFGLAPILHARKTDIYGALKDGSNRMTGTPTRLRVRRALVIGEIALAVVLVIGCTVMVRSFVSLQHVELGMKPDHLLTFEIELPRKSYPQATGAVFWERLETRLRALPGVTHAALIDGMPPARPINANDLFFVGRPPPQKGEAPWNVDYWQVCSDDFLDTLGGRLVRGRSILPSDTADSPPVVLINETFAARFFPNQDPIGQQLSVWGDRPPAPVQTIVGIVADIKQAGVDQPAGTEVFLPWRQHVQLHDEGQPGYSPRIMIAVLRTDGDPADLGPGVQRVVADLDPTLPVSKMRTMDNVVWEAVAKPRFLAFLLSCFAGVALVLAAVGIYGVMAHTVAQRTHELGLRMALGAHPAQVRKLVFRQAAMLVAAGVGIGLVGAVGLQLALSSSLTKLFYGAELSQPVLLAGVAIAVTATAMLATFVPARRATKIEPSVALRSE